jgi:hypothetical protein
MIEIEANLELGTHPRNDSPENFHANLENLWYRTDGIAAQAETQVLVNSLDEGGSLIGTQRVNERRWGSDESHV